MAQRIRQTWRQMAMMALALTLGTGTALAGGKKEKGKDKPRPAFTLDKQQEALRKEGYKLAGDKNYGFVNKETLKKAKADKAIIHGSWIQGQTQSLDLQGNALPLPTGYVAVTKYNDSIYLTRNMASEAMAYELYNTQRGRTIACMTEPSDMEMARYYNAVLIRSRQGGAYVSEMRTLDGQHSVWMIDENKYLFAFSINDSCLKDTTSAQCIEWAKAYKAWAYGDKPRLDDQHLYEGNRWIEQMKAAYQKKDYRTATCCADQLTTFDLDAMWDKNGLFACELKDYQVSSLYNLGRYKAVLQAFTSQLGSLLNAMYYSPETKTMKYMYLDDEVKNKYLAHFQKTCRNAQQLQAQREQQNAALFGAIFGAVAGTVGNITGGGSTPATTSVPVSSAYSSGSAAPASQQRSSGSSSSSSSSSASAPAAKRQVQCRACSGRGFVIDERNAGERKYCSKCGETRQAHTHKTCGACKGKGYKEQ